MNKTNNPSSIQEERYTVNFDIDKIEASINSGFIEVPHFETVEEFMAWLEDTARNI